MAGARGDLPRTMTQREATELLIAHGWVKERGGKHVVKMVKQGCRPITLPRHQGKAYGVDLTSRILRQAGLR